MECGPIHFQFNLSIVAINAVARPMTFANNDRFVPASFNFAISSVFSFSEMGSHPSQKEKGPILKRARVRFECWVVNAKCSVECGPNEVYVLTPCFGGTGGGGCGHVER